MHARCFDRPHARENVHWNHVKCHLQLPVKTESQFTQRKLKFTFNITGCRNSNSEAALASSSYPQDSSSSSVGTIENQLYRGEFCALVRHIPQSTSAAH